jgi:Domain of unknown function (DUF4386)
VTPLSKNARIAGLLYVAASVVGVVRLMYVPKALVVSGNASITAANIAAHESLFRFGIVCNLVGATLWLCVPLALYRLLKGVDQTLAALMVLLGAVMQVPLFFVNTATDMAALLFARGGDLVAAFDRPQRDAFVLLFLEVHHSIDLANAIFWGLWLIPFGMLVYRSRFFPRFLGVWLIAACFGWLAFSVTGFLFPAYEDKAFTYGQPLMIGELVMMLWLVVMGARTATEE